MDQDTYSGPRFDSLELRPFLTQNEFRDFVAGASGSMAIVKTVHGFALQGRIEPLLGLAAVRLNRDDGEAFDVFSDDVCDIRVLSLVPPGRVAAVS